ncbi:hypothetical protein DFH27DRAFT_605592 [Peziza echinospora]|nr:hypothetical protein DFH27DRAFT_605592 [Peziza echinospora]
MATQLYDRMQNPEKKSIEQFPHLTHEEFKLAGESLCALLQRSTIDYEWKAQDEDETSAQLVIYREIPIDEAAECIDPEEVVFLDEEVDDQESFTRIRGKDAKALVEYHIVLSPSYAVPTLYFNMTIGSAPAGLDLIYKYLVEPNGYKDLMEEVGVMGAISQGNHPINGMVYWFIHPCGTASTLEEWGEGFGVGGGGGGTECITLTNYLQIWLGFVGGCVGLHLPAEAVASQQVEN